MGRNMDKVICQDDSFLSCLILAPLNSGKGESALNACHIWRDAARCLHISFFVIVLHSGLLSFYWNGFAKTVHVKMKLKEKRG